MHHDRKPVAGLIALGAMLAMPLAFAQEPPPAESVPQQQMPPAESVAQPLTWEDLDVDGDGKLSREEAARVASLSEAFDAADADGDGLLTQDEYRAHAEKESAVPSSPQGEG